MLRFARALVMAPPPVFYAAVAAASALGAAAADSSPTGLDAANLMARAALGAGMPLAARSAGPAACAVAGVLAVVSSGGSSEAAVAAGLALGVVAAVLATGEAAPTLSALAGAGLAQAALRLVWPDPTGASALAAAAVIAPVLLVGLSRGPRQARRRAGWAAGGLAVFALAASVLAVLAALAARTAVDDGVRAAREGLVAVERADRDAAAASFDTAAAAFAKADLSIGAWWARPALAVPVVGQHARALRTLAGSGVDLAGVGARAAREADPASLRLTNGGFDLDALTEVREPVEAALDSLVRSDRRLARARSPWLVEPVAARVDELGDRVSSTLASTRTAVLALRAAPGLLGGNGPRRYFLAVQTPAEARASGGLIGNWGELVAEDGRLTLGRFGRIQDLNIGVEGRPRRISGPPDYLRRYSPYMPERYWQTVTMSPDFPSVAEVIAELYPQSGGIPVDGVVSVDPFAFAAFLRLVGPVPVEGRTEPLTADNAARELLHEQYLQFQEVDRVDFLDAATHSLFSKLTSTTLPAPRQVAEVLSPVVAGRHLQLASTHPGEQEFFEHIGAAGAVPPVRGDSLGVVTQNFNGNKIDWFLRRSYTYDAEYDPDSGQVTSRLEIRLRNDAPAQGLPKSVILFGGSPVPGQPVPAPGENILLLSVYSPLALARMEAEGQTLEVSQQNELGRRVYSALVRVPPGATQTVRLELSGRIPGGGAYRLDVSRQPTVTPDKLDVSVAFPPGWAVRSSRGLRGSSVRLAATQVPVVRNLTFRATVGAGGDGFLDRLRRGR